MIRTPNEISVALTRSEMNEVHALNEIEYYEMLADIPDDQEGRDRKRNIKKANKNRLERHAKWLKMMELTEDEKEEQAQAKKELEMNLKKQRGANKFANNQ